MLFTHLPCDGVCFNSLELDAINIYLLLREQDRGNMTGTSADQFEVELEGIETARLLFKCSGINTKEEGYPLLEQLKTHVAALKAVREDDLHMDVVELTNRVLYLVLCETYPVIEEMLGDAFEAIYNEITEMIDSLTELEV